MKQKKIIITIVFLLNLNILAQNHFQPIFSGNPYQAMNIYVVKAEHNGQDLRVGDEIGIFYNDICVGAAILNTVVSSSNILSIVASADDPTTTELDGFQEGGTIVFKFWLSSEQKEVDVSEVDFYDNNGNPISEQKFSSLGTVIVGLNAVQSQIHIDVSPSSLNFGMVKIGEFLEKEVTISNSSTSTGNLEGNVAITGNDFTIVSGGGVFSIEPGGSKIVMIRFSPYVSGSHFGKLKINHNATNMVSPVEIILNGAGESNIQLSVYPTSLDFGTVIVGTSLEKKVNITNGTISTGNLEGEVSITGNDFFIVNGGGAFNLAPGSSREVIVKFNPTSSGNHTGTLIISHNATNESSPINMNLSGVGEAIFLNITPESLNVSEEAGSTTFNITSNVSWTVNEDVDWLNVSPTSGNGNGTVTVNYSANSYSSSRTANITVSGGGITRSVIVEQAANKLPLVVISSPKDGQKFIKADIVVEGIANDEDGSVSKVQVKLNDGDWSDASGTTTWRKEITLEPGDNIISVKAIDDLGAETSPLVKITVVYEPAALSVDPESLSVGSESGSVSFNISSNVDWNVSENADWLNVSPTSGNGNGTITVNYTANSSCKSRTAMITISGGGLSKHVTVNQRGYSFIESLEVFPEKWAVRSHAGSKTFNIITNGSWSVTSYADWISVSPTSGSGNGIITVSYTENRASSQRIAEINIQVVNSSRSVMLAQAGELDKGDTWMEQYSGENLNFYSVSVVDEDVAWIGAESGYVLKTTDGGNSWQSMRVDTVAIVNLFALDDQICFVAVNLPNMAQIKRTLDGGLNWETVYELNASTAFINYIYMFDAQNGYAQGDPVDGKYLLLNTFDSGDSWDPAATLNATEPGECGYNNSMCWLGDYGWFGTNKSAIYKTTDGGKNWSKINVNCTKVLGVSFIDPQHGLIGGYDQRHLTPIVSYTMDGGKNWNAFYVDGSILSVSSVVMLSQQDWWYIYAEKVFHSSDGGANWKKILTAKDILTYMNLKQKNDNIYGWIIGVGGVVIKINQNLTGISKINFNKIINYKLFSNYPNPFNPTTTITYEIPRASKVILTIYNTLGQKIKTLVNKQQTAGRYELVWDGRNETEQEVASGIYLYQLKAGDFVETKKMILMR